MQVIQIGAGSYDLAELCKSAPAGGSSSSVGRQISRNNVRSQPRYQRAKISSAPQLGSLIDDLWWVALEVGITACGVLGCGAGRVAAVAIPHRVNEVAANANQSPVPLSQLQAYPRALKPPPNSRRFHVLTFYCARLRP